MKPIYILQTEKLGLYLPLIWCATSLLVGLGFFDVGGAIFVSIMSFLMCLILNKLSQFVLSFQSHSGIVSNETFQIVVKFIWFGSLVGFLMNFINAILSKPFQEAYFQCAFSIVYFGFALAASKKWDDKFEFTPN